MKIRIKASYFVGVRLGLEPRNDLGVDTAAVRAAGQHSQGKWEMG